MFDDPYAQAFLDAAPGVLPEEPRTAGELAGLGPLASLGAVFSFHGVIRTRFFDDYLLAAAAGGCHQVVLLAAGLDTRAFRLPWPDGVRLFELDLPTVLSFKDVVLAQQAAVPRCARMTVPVDLRANWPVELAKAGFDHTVPTAWLAEGLLLYRCADDAPHPRPRNPRRLLWSSRSNPVSRRLSHRAAPLSGWRSSGHV